MLQTQVSQAHPPQPGQRIGLAPHPSEVLHCLHSLTQSESHAVLQQ
jgi:hypothetical protein